MKTFSCILIGVILFVFTNDIVTTPIKAAEIEFTVDQEVASDAVRLIDAKGSNVSPIATEIPCLLQKILPKSAGLSPYLARIGQPFIVEKKNISLLVKHLIRRPLVLGKCKVAIGLIPWSWTAISTSVDFSTSGAFLNGKLLIEHPGGSTTNSFSLPVQMAFIPSDNSLKLSLQSGAVPVSVYIGGMLRTLGGVDLTPFYRATIPMVGLIPVPAIGQVSSTLNNVSIQFLNSKVSVSANVSFN